jgi:hypothetical protein
MTDRALQKNTHIADDHPERITYCSRILSSDDHITVKDYMFGSIVPTLDVLPFAYFSTFYHSEHFVQKKKIS